jgi:hypothetical protein
VWPQIYHQVLAADILYSLQHLGYTIPSQAERLDRRGRLFDLRAGRRARTSGAGGSGETYVAPVPGRPAFWSVSFRTKVPIGRL